MALCEESCRVFIFENQVTNYERSFESETYIYAEDTQTKNFKRVEDAFAGEAEKADFSTEEEMIC